MIVMKFGGTSVGTGERMLNVARIAARTTEQTTEPPIVVVSAMSGVTDSLVRAATTAADGDKETFRAIRKELQVKHEQAIIDCAIPAALALPLRTEVDSLLDWFENLCQSMSTLGELTPRGLDVVSGLGERLSARLVAGAMLGQGIKAEMVEATELIVTESNFGSATPLMEPTMHKVRARLLPLCQSGVVPVVTGFIGATQDGIPTTLGRGGSDYSATIIGSCLPADEVWIWTDVNGVMTADPRIVPEAQTLPVISYAEVAELAYFGAKVLHPKTIQPVADAEILVRVLNSFAPDNPGTLVCPVVDDPPLVTGITAIKDLNLITVQGAGMLGVPGIAGRVFSAVAGSGVSILMITQASSEQSICFVVRSQDTAAVLASVESELALEIARDELEHVCSHEQVGIIAVVGAGMRGTPGIAARVFGAMANTGTNILSIAQGSSEYNISLVVDRDEIDQGVRAIHCEFCLGSVGEN